MLKLCSYVCVYFKGVATVSVCFPVTMFRGIKV